MSYAICLIQLHKFVVACVACNWIYKQWSLRFIKIIKKSPFFFPHLIMEKKLSFKGFRFKSKVQILILHKQTKQQHIKTHKLHSNKMYSTQHKMTNKIQSN
jgi:hypothetical protein